MTTSLLRDARLNDRIVAAFEADGADVWYSAGFKARMLDGIADPEAYDQVMDVLDVWFDSGSTHSFVLRDREDGAPDGIADVYLEGTDQHRGWFQSSLLQASATKGRAPYRNVVTHGFTLDEKGMKMSKSLGNTIVPAKVIEQYGADILRLWVAQADYTADQRIGPEILKAPPTAIAACATRCASCWGRWPGSTMPNASSPPDARAGAVDAAPAGAAGSPGSPGLCGVRFPGRVPDAVPVLHRRSVGLLFRRAQGRAVLRRGGQRP